MILLWYSFDVIKFRPQSVPNYISGKSVTKEDKKQKEKTLDYQGF
ncbi:hypothetical protein DSOL_1470 [Desulfosporosinus metallidurans]|uniref:Uncharacterized protein n=1 Tax=Desulfosporosinus metallidurans TaxID=1888891 RepID=A0A1Q8QZB6_9FIRM|nr:hypothetical protein DSOL_1470 [Desulfosporosinus metallidurans]